MSYTWIYKFLSLKGNKYLQAILQFQYTDLRPAPDTRIVPDKDGYFSIEFVNTGMSGVREITNEFSKHGELAKVHQGGAKNVVKRVTVSYTDIESAVRAIHAYTNSKVMEIFIKSLIAFRKQVNFFMLILAR